jgi:hypothetical protein
MPIFNYCNTKFVLIVCLLCNCGALILFTVSNEYYILVLSRVLVGFFQVRIIIIKRIGVLLHLLPCMGRSFCRWEKKDNMDYTATIRCAARCYPWVYNDCFLGGFSSCNLSILHFITVEMDFLSSSRTLSASGVMLYVHSSTIYSLLR